ncbi:MAG: Flp family type IVb pilin [Alphaproteobacteria bacterium]|nr:Flp family type IVb pilin [Alphaproteobacteria bacterium]
MDRRTSFFDDQGGVAAIQYALVAGVLSLVVLACSLALREPLIELYHDMASQANDALIVEPATEPPAKP